MTQPDFIRTQKLSCPRDDLPLFQPLDLRIQRGEIWQISGPNGCGKTTLLHSLCTLFSDYEGEILWQGKSLRQPLPSYLAQCCYIGHQAALHPPLSARENLHFYRQLCSNPLEQPLNDILNTVGLYGFEDVPVQHLSAGQRRRVTLGRLLLADTPLWILDEPFTAIDPQGIQWLLELFIRHSQQRGVVIFSSHHHLAGLPANMHHLNLANFQP
jgi:heme exporter protein A